MPADLTSLLRLQVPVIVQVAQRTMAVEEILALAPGSIIELPKAADEPLEVLVDDKLVAKGTAVKIGENFGVRITAVGDTRRRLGSLAPPAEASGGPAGAAAAGAQAAAGQGR